MLFLFFLGLAAFVGASSPLMPWLALMYMAANITLNLSAITLVKRGGAVATVVFFFSILFMSFFDVHGGQHHAEPVGYHPRQTKEKRGGAVATVVFFFLRVFFQRLYKPHPRQKHFKKNFSQFKIKK
jgi:hypothetical protein